MFLKKKKNCILLFS